MASRSATTWLERCDAPTSRRDEPLTPRQWVQFLEAECLGYEDDVGPAGGFVVDDQRLCEQGSGTAYTLHPDVLSWQAVFAYAPQPFVEVADEFLVAHDEDDVAAGVGVGAELAAGA